MPCAFENMLHKSIGVFNKRLKRFSIAAFARRSPMPSRVPRKIRRLFQIEGIDQFTPSPAVFVPTVKQHHRARGRRRRPCPVEKLHTVPGGKRLLSFH